MHKYLFQSLLCAGLVIFGLALFLYQDELHTFINNHIFSKVPEDYIFYVAGVVIVGGVFYSLYELITEPNYRLYNSVQFTGALLALIAFGLVLYLDETKVTYDQCRQPDDVVTQVLCILLAPKQ